MKKITPERLIKALDKTAKYFENSPEAKISKVLVEVGFKSLAYQSSGYESNAVEDKHRLELVYQGFFDSEEISKRVVKYGISEDAAIQDVWRISEEKLLDKKYERYEKIKAIQHKYQVSGLEPKEINVEGETLTYHIPSYWLDLLEEDLAIMKAESIKLTNFFLSLMRKFKMKLFHLKPDSEGEENWVETTPAIVVSYAKNSNSADMSQMKYYLNYYELVTVGSTVHKKKPESELDELVWQIDLFVSNRTQDGVEKEEWFCARIGRGKPPIV